MRRAILSPDAEADLIEIWLYIAERGSPRAADRFHDQLVARCERLALAPGVGRPRLEFGLSVRAYTFKTYVIVYRPSEQGVDIPRILHGARDVDRMPGD